MKTKNEQLDDIEDYALQGSLRMTIVLLVRFIRNYIKEP